MNSAGQKVCARHNFVADIGVELGVFDFEKLNFDQLNQASPRCLLFQASKLLPHMLGVTMGAQNYKCNLKPQIRKAAKIEK